MKDISRRKFFASGAAAGGAFALPSLLSAPAIAQSLSGTGQVVVYDGGGAWGEAKNIAYFEPFQAETGIEVIRQSAGTVGSLRAGILAGQPAYDVANIGGSSIDGLARDGLLIPIDYGWFSAGDRDAFNPVAAGEHFVPALFYSLIIAYDADRFSSNAPVNWGDVWDTDAFGGGRSLATGAWGPDGGTFEAALLADGVSPEQLYPIDWDRAFRSLDRLRPEIIKFWSSGAEAVQLIADRQISAGSAWNGRISGAQEQGLNIRGSWDQGILQWDAWAVPTGAANTENAMKFIAFASRPENQAVFAQNILYGPTNARAFDLLAPERAIQLPTSPTQRDKQVVQNYDFWNAADAGKEANYARAVVEWELWLAGAR